MSASVTDQIRDYFADVDRRQGAVDVAAVLRRVEERQVTIIAPLDERPTRSRNWWVAGWAGAAVAGLVVVGLVVTRSDPTRPDQLDITPSTTTPITTASTTTPTTTTTTVSTTTTTVAAIPAEGLSAPPLRVGPGAWTVVAALAAGQPAEGIAAVVEEVRTWAGVIDVAAVDGVAAWQNLTGLTSDCAGGETTPPCGPGVAVLTYDSSMGPTALRLKTDYAMSVLTPNDIPERFVAGYLDAAINTASPLPLQFDPTTYGTEQPLTGRFDYLGPEGSECWPNPCDVTVEIDTDGVLVTAGFSAHEWREGGQVGNLLIDRSGHGGVLVNLRESIGGHRVYELSFLPLEAALIRFELADGTPTWQRPIAGMALMVDQPRTGDYGDGEPPIVGPFVVLDASGREIMHINDTPDGPLIDNLRVAALDAASPTGTGLTTEVVATLNGESVRFAGGDYVTFGEDLVVADGALWLHTEDDNRQTAVVTVDMMTLAVGRIPIDGIAGPLLVSSGAIWVGSIGGDGEGAISRIDLTSRTVTDRIEIPGSFQYLVDLIVADGGLWVTGSDTGYVRIDLATRAVETYPAEIAQSETWVGEIDGHLWSYGGGRPLTRIELDTGDIQPFDDIWQGSRSSAMAAGDAIWLAEWDGALARFDTATGEITDRLSLGTDVKWWSGVFVDDAVWFANGSTDTITGIDATTAEVTASITVELNPLVMTAHDGAIWVGHHDGLVSRIDIETREVTDVIRVGGELNRPVASDETIWLVESSDMTEGTIRRITGTP